MIIGGKILKNLLRGQIFALEASLFRHHDVLAVLVGLYYEFPATCLKCTDLKREQSHIPSTGIYYYYYYFNDKILVLPTFHSFHTALADVDHSCLCRKTIQL